MSLDYVPEDVRLVELRRGTPGDPRQPLLHLPGPDQSESTVGGKLEVRVRPNVKMTGAQQDAAKPLPAVVSPSPLTCYPLIIRERQ